MNRRIWIAIIALVLVVAVIVGTTQMAGQQTEAAPVSLNNYSDYAAAGTPGSVNYAVADGQLYAGSLNGWSAVKTPNGVTVSAVAVDSANSETVYIGAEGELALYRTSDRGENWLHIPLPTEISGSVTDIAVDGFQRLVYVGTDSAGLFRLRDVGASVIASGQLLLDEPVTQVVADSTGKGLAFALTPNNLYRSEEYGMRWTPVEDLGSAPTAVAIANTDPATVYVGTTDRGVLKSYDGLSWTLRNDGLGYAPGTRLTVESLAVDPTQPEVLYVASSYLHGTGTVYSTPARVSMTADGGSAWQTLEEELSGGVAGLLPVSGQTGSVYALARLQEQPLALGNAPALAAQPAEAAAVASGSGVSVAAWVVAGLAALALLFAIASDLGGGRRRQVAEREPAARAVRNG